MQLKNLLGRERIYWDGASGTFLQARGLAAGELPEVWNLTHPDVIREMAQAYYEAGATIVNANIFGANSLAFPDNLTEIIEAGVHLACEARDSFDGARFVALDIGPLGKLLEPMGDLPFEKAVEIFAEKVRIGAAAGADLILIETMADTYEMKAAVLAAKENSDLPVFVTVTFNEKGQLLSGADPEAVVALLEGLGVDALGMNCGLGPKQMLPLAERLSRISSLPLIVNPNAGLPHTEGERTVFDVGPEEFAELMKEIARLGVQVLGGCCGTSPEHIRQMIEAVKDIPIALPSEKDRTVVSSFGRAVVIGEDPVVIGERINPTGKKKFQAALREKNIEYILQQGIEQEESGADILDINVGLPEIDETEMMLTVMTQLQSITPLPLQIDTSDPAALEAALRYYNGKAMINSVNGKRESIEAVLPLAKKYGAVVVGLCLDENGIPDNADGRVAIARRIYEAADEFGIARRDIVIDGLAMAVSSDSKGALVTLETIRRIKKELGGHSILGVSNISFGLPRREIINSTFLVMAMQEGLSCAIINPNNEPMMRAMRAFCALSDRDPAFEKYIGRYAGTKADVAASSRAAGSAVSGNLNAGKLNQESETAAGSLAVFVKKGLGAQAAEAARGALEKREALTLIDEEMIPALDEVGKGFADGSIFLPQLLMAAEAAQEAFAVIRESMAGRDSKVKGKVILATVKNDIHDIGKNIVKVMMENYGYEVIDLGKDVAPQLIAEAAVREDVRLVGLSALMTTTVVSMEETIRILRKQKPDCRVAVGGAVMTKEYAEKIGADFYSKDAMEMVRYADRLFGE